MVSDEQLVSDTPITNRWVVKDSRQEVEKTACSAQYPDRPETGIERKESVQKSKELWKLETVLGMIYIGIGVRVGLSSRDLNCPHWLVAHTEVVETLFFSEVAFRLRGRIVVRSKIGASHW